MQDFLPGISLPMSVLQQEFPQEKSYPLNYHKDACCGIIGQLPIPDGIGKS